MKRVNLRTMSNGTILLLRGEEGAYSKVLHPTSPLGKCGMSESSWINPLRSEKTRLLAYYSLTDREEHALLLGDALLNLAMAEFEEARAVKAIKDRNAEDDALTDKMIVRVFVDKDHVKDPSTFPAPEVTITTKDAKPYNELKERLENAQADVIQAQVKVKAEREPALEAALRESERGWGGRGRLDPSLGKA